MRSLPVGTVTISQRAVSARVEARQSVTIRTRARRRARVPGVDVPADEIVTLTEAAERLGCTRPYLSRASLQDAFPEPIAKLGRSRVYDMRAIREWWSNRPGRTGRPPLK